MSMSPAEITIRTMRGTRTVTAYPCGIPGLVISKAPSTQGWVITHVRSGFGVAWFIEASPEAVLAAAQALGELTDWTQSGFDVSDEVNGADIDAAVEPWGGCRWTARDPLGRGPEDMHQALGACWCGRSHTARDAIKLNGGGS